MTAVLKHELKIYFRSLTAYIFGAFLLCFVGLGAMVYNIRAGISNFEYTLNFSGIIFALIVPVLTMRVLAEERKQRTDQLLYALPITTTQVVLGKYIALLIMFIIPLGIICIYPVLFDQYGKVSYLTAYGALLAYFFLGAALIAVGVFISSITDSQGFAAGLGIAVILLNYYSVALSQYVSSSAVGSMAALVACGIVLGLLVKFMTGSENIGVLVGGILAAGVMIIYFFNADLFKGLFPKIMTKLSLFRQFNIIVNGVFDLAAIVYFVSVIIFFLFLAVQSLEKRRYN
ncbi:MAG: ABC transporter permease [Eubacteriales bacterium]|nr:ABC transporter permease [Eubacteriales bacterium]